MQEASDVFTVTELLQCDLHFALGQERLMQQLHWRKWGRRIALDIASGMSCAHLDARMLHGSCYRLGCKPRWPADTSSAHNDAFGGPAFTAAVFPVVRQPQLMRYAGADLHDTKSAVHFGEVEPQSVPAHVAG